MAAGGGGSSKGSSSSSRGGGSGSSSRSSTGASSRSSSSDSDSPGGSGSSSRSSTGASSRSSAGSEGGGGSNSRSSTGPSSSRGPSASSPAGGSRAAAGGGGGGGFNSSGNSSSRGGVSSGPSASSPAGGSRAASGGGGGGFSSQAGRTSTGPSASSPAGGSRAASGGGSFSSIGSSRQADATSRSPSSSSPAGGAQAAAGYGVGTVTGSRGGLMSAAGMARGSTPPTVSARAAEDQSRAALAGYGKEVVGVIGAGPGYTTVKLGDGTIENRSGTLASRNNNPGNIRASAFTQSRGAVGQAGGFAVFGTKDQGLSAMGGLLSTDGYAGKTIAGAISRYAPPKENDTAAYSASVARAVGVPPSTNLSDLTPGQRAAMVSEMTRVEGNAPYKATTVKPGADWSLPGSAATTRVAGVTSPNVPTPTSAPRSLATPTPAPRDSMSTVASFTGKYLGGTMTNFAGSVGSPRAVQAINNALAQPAQTPATQRIAPQASISPAVQKAFPKYDGVTKAEIDWSGLPQAKRNQMPNADVQDITARSVAAGAPGYSFRATSGKGVVGKAHNHPGGYAVDGKLVNPQGKVVSYSEDPQAYRSVAKAAAAMGAAGVGLYEESGHIHVDTTPGKASRAWGQNGSISSLDKDAAAEIKAGYALAEGRTIASPPAVAASAATTAGSDVPQPSTAPVPAAAPKRSMGATVAATGLDAGLGMIPGIGMGVGLLNAGLAITGNRTIGQRVVDDFNSGSNAGYRDTIGADQGGRSRDGEATPDSPIVAAAPEPAPPVVMDFGVKYLGYRDPTPRPTPAEKWSRSA